MSTYFVERIGKRVWKIVENDHFGQYPFIYVIRGVDKIIFIDTGTGHPSNIKKFVDSNFNPNKLPYVLALTHIHFDHVGGVCHFKNQPDVLDICMGSRNQVFSKNIDINSLAAAHPGCHCESFEVSRWLQEGDLIYLDDSDQRKDKALEVVFTPGHTPDSISYFMRFGEKRLFVGDHLYPFTAIHLDCIGSNCSDFVKSLDHLIQFARTVSKEPPVPDELPLPEESLQIQYSTDTLQTTQPPAVIHPSNVGAVAEFLSILGLTPDSIYQKWDPEKLLSLCDGSVETAINFYLTEGDQLGAICPPKKPSEMASPAASTTQQKPRESPYLQQYTQNSDLMLSCGHVEGNLPSSALGEMKSIMEFVKLGNLKPSHVDGNYAEYNVQNFTIILPLNWKWE